MGNHSLSCYRVYVTARARPVVIWASAGIDQRFLHPARTQALVIAAANEEEAIERAISIGSNLMGGRPVTIDRIDLKCEMGSHVNEFYPIRSDARAVGVSWDWLTK